jgi:hypothetical protein
MIDFDVGQKHYNGTYLPEIAPEEGAAASRGGEPATSIATNPCDPRVWCPYVTGRRRVRLGPSGSDRLPPEKDRLERERRRGPPASLHARLSCVLDGGGGAGGTLNATCGRRRYCAARSRQHATRAPPTRWATISCWPRVVDSMRPDNGFCAKASIPVRVCHCNLQLCFLSQYLGRSHQ